jgi:DNA-binding beta-propeller fold protein YncE
VKTQPASFLCHVLILAWWMSVIQSTSGEEIHSPWAVRFSPDGRTLALSDATAPCVRIIDPEALKARASIPLTGRPEGLAWSADGTRIFASEAGAGTVAEIDANQGKITRRFTTGRYPSGLALSGKRDQLLVCDRGLDRLTILDIRNGNTPIHLPVGRQPMHVAISPDETLAVVSNLIPGTAATDPGHATHVTIVDLEKQSVRAEVRLPTGSTNARGIAIDPEGRKAYVVHTLGRFHLPTTQLDRGWVNTNSLSIIDLTSATRIATVLLDQVTDGAADPWDLAIAPDGTRVFITLSGVHQLAAIDLRKLTAIIGTEPDAFTNDLSTMHREGILRRIDLPVKGPRGIHASPDGRTLAIAGYFSGTVCLLDQGLQNPATLAFGAPQSPGPVRHGEFVFHSADHCFQRWLSCATCHAEARADGLNWDLLNDGIGNPKNARSMLLSHATPPVMSLGVRSDMETAARAGFIHIQFTQPNDADLEAVQAYLRSLEPETSPHRQPDGSLTESAARGEKIFLRKSVGCASCHPAPLFTNLKLKDVGTATPLDRDKSEYDVPTLIELWRTPPYLHDGRAATLREVLIDHNPDDDHGTTSGLDENEINDLIQYLLSL